MVNATFPIVVIGASAGGVSALKTLSTLLLEDLNAAVFVVLHVPAGSTSRLPEILNFAKNLPAAHATDGERIRPGRIYVAPPDTHLQVDSKFVRLVRGPRENRQRPAVDPLFRTAAHAFRERVIGIVLSGALDDGTAGLRVIKSLGGTAIVQDPNEAETPDMPRSALEHVKVDHCLPLRAIAQLVVELTGDRRMKPHESRASSQPAEELRTHTGSPGQEVDADLALAETRGRPPSAFTCPECHGTMWEVDELMRFECRVGHAFSLQSMVTEQFQSLERALWIALRMFEENVAMARRIQTHANERGRTLLARHYEERVRELEEQASTIKAVLLSVPTGAPAPDLVGS